MFSLGVVLIALSWSLSQFVSAFEILSRQLVANPQFQTGLDGWQPGIPPGDDVFAVPGELILASQGHERLKVEQIVDLPPGTTKVILSAQVAVRGVQAGSTGETARGYLLRHQSDGDRDWRGHQLFGLEGHHTQHREEKVYALPNGERRVTVGFMLNKARGTLAVHSVGLWAAADRPLYQQLRGGLLIGWLGFGALLLAFAARDAERNRLVTALIVIACVACAAILLPGDRERALTTTFLGDHAAAGVIDTVGHIGVFWIISLAACVIRRRDPWWGRVAFLLLLAAVTETLQLFLPGRETSWSDFHLDLVGIAGGFLSFLAVRPFLKRRRSRKHRSRSSRERAHSHGQSKSSRNDNRSQKALKP